MKFLVLALDAKPGLAWFLSHELAKKLELVPFLFSVAERKHVLVKFLALA